MSDAFTPNEMMTIAASRALKNDDVCFVGIGAPSAACNVARLTHAPDITLIYESGTIGTAPDVLPLSIGDGELCDTAITTVSVPEMFRYWLQGGRISIGFLGAAQLDKFGNINTTVIGDYRHPKTRLPGGGGAPEIATSAQGNLHHHGAVEARHGREDRLLHLLRPWRRRRPSQASRHRHRRARRCSSPTSPSGSPTRSTKEFTVVSLHPGVTREQVQETCGWPAKFADRLEETPAPTELELKTLRDLQARTKAAHGATREGRRDLNGRSIHLRLHPHADRPFRRRARRRSAPTISAPCR